MRKSVKKHYAQLDQFVRAANLGWEEIFRHNDFPTLEELDPFGAHRDLLARIDRAFQSKFRKIRPPADVPLLIFPRWGSAALADWQRLHCYALVRRLFDSLDFLTRRSPHSRSGTRQIPLALQVSVNADGSISRVRDAYEDFLAELSRADLRRLRSCPGCSRFFVAWRDDQKACGRRCANLVRVQRFRQKTPEYTANRRFRKRTGLEAVRHRRRQVIELHNALRSNEISAAPLLTPHLTGDKPSRHPRRSQ